MEATTHDELAQHLGELPIRLYERIQEREVFSATRSSKDRTRGCLRVATRQEGPGAAFDYVTILTSNRARRARFRHQS